MMSDLLLLVTWTTLSVVIAKSERGQYQDLSICGFRPGRPFARGDDCLATVAKHYEWRDGRTFLIFTKRARRFRQSASMPHKFQSQQNQTGDERRR
jgi:hypothetical protein